MTHRILITFGVLTVFTVFTLVPASGQFYRYTDENGVVRYTDDLSLVPPDQIKAAKGYVELKEAPDRPATTDEKPATAETPALDVGRDADLEATAQKLQAMKEELQQQYQALIQEQKTLHEKGRKVTQNKAEARKYKESQAAFAKRHQAYEAKRKDYEAAVQTYNAEVARRQAPPKTE